jgi:hypothetical protein
MALAARAPRPQLLVAAAAVIALVELKAAALRPYSRHGEGWQSHCRGGNGIRALGLGKDMALTEARQQALYPLLLRLVDVAGATCMGINTNRSFRDSVFDVVIVDGSGQIQLHNLIVPLSKAERVILVGWS